MLGSGKAALIVVIVLLIFLGLFYAAVFNTNLNGVLKPTVSTTTSNRAITTVQRVLTSLTIDIPQTGCQVPTSSGISQCPAGTTIPTYNLALGGKVTFRNTQSGGSVINGVDTETEGVCFIVYPQGVSGLPPCYVEGGLDPLEATLVSPGRAYSVTLSIAGSYQVAFIPSSGSSAIEGGSIVVLS